jgi:hypothetical protein
LTLPTYGRWLLRRRRRPRPVLGGQGTMIAWTEFGGWTAWRGTVTAVGLVAVTVRDEHPGVRYEIWFRHDGSQVQERTIKLSTNQEPLLEYAREVVRHAREKPENTDLDVEVTKQWIKLLDAQDRVTEALAQVDAEMNRLTQCATDLANARRVPVTAIANALGKSRQWVYNLQKTRRQPVG